MQENNEKKASALTDEEKAMAAAEAALEEESGRIRRLGKSFWGIVIKVAAVILSCFHFYTAGFGNLPVIRQRSFHLAFVMFLIFLLYLLLTFVFSMGLSLLDSRLRKLRPIR